MIPVPVDMSIEYYLEGEVRVKSSIAIASKMLTQELLITGYDRHPPFLKDMALQSPAP